MPCCDLLPLGAERCRILGTYTQRAGKDQRSTRTRKLPFPVATPLSSPTASGQTNIFPTAHSSTCILMLLLRLSKAAEPLLVTAPPKAAFTVESRRVRDLAENSPAGTRLQAGELSPWCCQGGDRRPNADGGVTKAGTTERAAASDI